MKQPLISVVIPTFERPDLLERACLTVRNQTYKNIELIVVDDNSIKSYQEALAKVKDFDIKYFKRNKNGGGSAARNTGIKMSAGKYIAFLDDDDIWESTKLEKQMALMTREIQAAHCGYKLKSNSKIRIESRKIITFDDLKENNKLASTSGMMCKASILREVMFDENLHRSQDWDIYLRISKITSFAYAQEPLYIYDDGDHARMSNKFAKLTLSEYRLKLDMLKKHKRHLYEKAYSKHVAELILPSLKVRKDKLRVFLFCAEEIGIISTTLHLFRMLFYKIIR